MKKLLLLLFLIPNLVFASSDDGWRVFLIPLYIAMPFLLLIFFSKIGTRMMWILIVIAFLYMVVSKN